MSQQHFVHPPYAPTPSSRPHYGYYYQQQPQMMMPSSNEPIINPYEMFAQQQQQQLMHYNQVHPSMVPPVNQGMPIPMDQMHAMQQSMMMAPSPHTQPVGYSLVPVVQMVMVPAQPPPTPTPPQRKILSLTNTNGAPVEVPQTSVVEKGKRNVLSIVNPENNVELPKSPLKIKIPSVDAITTVKSPVSHGTTSGKSLLKIEKPSQALVKNVPSVEEVNAADRAVAAEEILNKSEEEEPRRDSKNKKKKQSKSQQRSEGGEENRKSAAETDDDSPPSNVERAEDEEEDVQTAVASDSHEFMPVKNRMSRRLHEIATAKDALKKAELEEADDCAEKRYSRHVFHLVNNLQETLVESSKSDLVNREKLFELGVRREESPRSKFKKTLERGGTLEKSSPGLNPCFMGSVKSESRSSVQQKFGKYQQNKKEITPAKFGSIARPERGDGASSAKIIARPVAPSVELKKSENAYRPLKTANSGEAAAEEDDTAKKLKAVRSLFNKVTPASAESIMKQFIALDVCTSRELMNGVVDVIFDKSVAEPKFCAIYASLCREVIVGCSKTVFRTALIHRAQKVFENKAENASLDELREKIKEETDAKKRKNLESDLLEIETKQRQRIFGNINFISVLFQKEMLPPTVVINAATTLLKHLRVIDGFLDEEALMCCIRLLEGCGRLLSKPPAQPVANAWRANEKQSSTDDAKMLQLLINTLAKLRDDGDKDPARKMKPRVRFALLDLVDLQKNGWVKKEQR